MKSLALALIMFAASVLSPGCGEEEPNHLIGDWIFTDGSCGVGATYNENNGYAYLLICQLTDGSYGLQIESGTYAANGKTLTTSANRATCPEVTKVETLSYTATETSLVLSTPTGVISLSRNPSTGGGGVAATYGCFREDGFYPLPLLPV